MINVIIADDEPLVRKGIIKMLEEEKEINIIGVAENGQKAFELCKKHKPDIVIMDLRMPECDGIEGTKLIKDYDKSIKVLVLTIIELEEDRKKIQKNGIEGYLIKNYDYDEISNAVKLIYKGYKIFGKSVILPTDTASLQMDLVEELGLNDLELKVLKGIIKGLPNAKIASELNYSEGSVRNAVTKLREKFEDKGLISKTNESDASVRVKLAVAAVKQGFG